jgi:hypothetical protein
VIKLNKKKKHRPIKNIKDSKALAKTFVSVAVGNRYAKDIQRYRNRSKSAISEQLKQLKKVNLIIEEKEPLRKNTKTGIVLAKSKLRYYPNLKNLYKIPFANPELTFNKILEKPFNPRWKCIETEIQKLFNGYLYLLPRLTKFENLTLEELFSTFKQFLIHNLKSILKSIKMQKKHDCMQSLIYSEISKTNILRLLYKQEQIQKFLKEDYTQLFKINDDKIIYKLV